MPEQGRIALLDPALASQIAAGEVVERPASVVKELLENAIDAGSTFITLEAVQGGTQLIRISDNGKGIQREDIPLAFARHATSKLRNVDELQNLAWMGFRGEALYSIAAVSKVTLVTKRREDAVGSRVCCQGGELDTVQDAGCPDGTTLTVEDLFYNVPARKKFLKSPHAEAGYISSVVAKILLSHPEISIKFIHDGKIIYHSSGDNSLRNAIYTVYGKNAATNIVEIHDEMAGIHIDGCLGLPGIARANRQHELFFLNFRSIQNPMLSKAIENGYGTALMSQRFPFCVLHIQMPGPWVDVNVHPNKLQVRFADESRVFQAVSGIVGTAVRGMTQSPVDFAFAQASSPEPAPEIPTPSQSSMPLPQLAQALSQQSSQGTAHAAADDPASHEQITLRQAVRAYREQAFAQTAHAHRGYQDILAAPVQTSTLRQAQEDVPLAPSAATELPAWEDGQYTVLGTAFRTYIILESGETLIWIDQHAAHERLLFDRYCHQLQEGKIASQQLLIPQIIEVSYDEKTAILANLEVLEQAGFLLEEYGRLSFSIRALPQVLGQLQAQELVIQLLHVLESKEYPDLTERNCAIAQAACKRAVKAGDALDEQEIRQLYQLILQEKIPLTCPHGRPICMVMTRKDLEKQFKRVVT